MRNSSDMETWVCPNDRQLALRAKLGAGWSIHTTKSSTLFGKTEQLTVEETEKILKVIKQAEKIDQIEMTRIGCLADKLENMKNNATGNGKTQCLLCGDEFRLLGASPSRCSDCLKCMCSKCAVETVNSKLRPIQLCKICSENRELWRKSGAWFYKGLPHFVRPTSNNRRQDSNRLAPPSSSSSSFSGRSRSLRNSPRNNNTLTVNIPTSNNNNNNNAHYANSNAAYSDDNSNCSARGQQRMSLAVQQLGMGMGMGVGVGVRQPLPTFTRFVKNQRANDSDSSTDEEDDHHHSREKEKGGGGGGGEGTEEVNIVRKRVRPQQESESDNESIQAAKESLGASSQSELGEQDKHSAGSVDSSRSQPPLRAINFDACQSEEDLTSVPETPASLGMLEFSLTYNSKDKLLRCSVHRGKNLPAMDKNGLSDPYVKLHILPGIAKATKRRTRTISKTRNPEWGETFEYHGVTEDDVKTKTLRLSVYDADRMSSDFIGETRVPLKSLPKDHTKEFSVYLSGLQVGTSGSKSGEDGFSATDRGRILLGLMYSTVGEKLIVSVKRCSCLVPMDSNGFSDPYVKIYLKPDKDKKTKHKTKVKSKSLNPEFNEEFFYPVVMPELTKKTLEVSVWDKDFGKNDYIGGVNFGPDSGAAELRHWLDVLKKPNEMTEQWHVLKNLQEVKEEKSSRR